ncbi:rhodanese-like domain-containing protein [Streptococcus sp. 10F2]
MEKITIAQLGALQDEKEIAILDVRDREDFALRHFEGSLNIPESGLADSLDQLDIKTVYHVVCTKGIRAQRASTFLNEQGYQVVQVVDGWFSYES